MTTTKTETWRWVPGYGSAYMVTSHGRVFSFVNGDRRGRFRPDHPARPLLDRARVGALSWVCTEAPVADLEEIP